MNSYRRSFLIGLGGFIIAGIVSNLATLLVFASGLLSFLIKMIPEGQPLVRILSGVMLAFIGIGIGGAAGGAVRGYFLQRIDYQGSRSRYVTAGAFANGIAHGILVIPILLFISLVSIYNIGSSTDLKSFLVLFGFIGGLFGIVNGLIYALLTVRIRYAWMPWIANVFGSLIGGALFGLLLWRPEWVAASPSKILTGAFFLIVAGLVMNATTGGMLGLAYQWLASKHVTQSEGAISPRRWQDITTITVGSLVFLVVMSTTNQITSFITLYQGSTRTSLVPITEGVHWQEHQTAAFTQDIPDDTVPDLAVASGGGFVVWSGQAGEVLFSYQQTGSPNTSWSDPMNISNSPQAESIHPQIAVSPDGAANIVWTEAGNIHFSECIQGTCSEPVELSIAVQNCESVSTAGEADWPAIAITPSGRVMVAWSSGENTVTATTWQASEGAGSGKSACLSQPGLLKPLARLSAGPGDTFNLSLSAPPGLPAGPVARARFKNNDWSDLEVIGQGTAAEVFTSRDGRSHFAWCSAEGKLEYLAEGSSGAGLDISGCTTRPALAEDASRRMHMIFYTDQLINNFGVPKNLPSLAEVISKDDGWSQPALVTRSESTAGLSAATGSDGALHLVWNHAQVGKGAIAYASQPAYDCSNTPLTSVAEVVLNVIENGGFHPVGYQSPFCGNRYDGMVYMPAPEAAFASLPPGEKNGFDQTAALLDDARYEVLLSNMQWDPDERELSPGYRLAEGVADLYRSVKADPAAYPRGMTVRILLGNYPNLSTLEYGDQIWGLVEDLATAGVDKLEDPSIGWKLEVANYAGSFPHSHTKFAVIDGKTLLAAGYNISWFHLPKDDPSGKGEGLTDLGLIITGPVAQTGLMVFDDMWEGANQVVCTELVVDDIHKGCEWKNASVSHPPETLKYYITESNDNAFAIYRTGNYKEADRVYGAALSSARSSIDAIHVSFSADLICLVNLVSPGVCNFQNSLSYMRALLYAAKQNGTQIRVIVENANMNGMENRVGLKILQDELDRLEISDRVEVRFFDGRLHAKSVLIDQQLLIIGSQNLHYSSFGEGGLLEFNAATTSPEAIDTYQKMFDYYWQQAIPAQAAQWGSSGN